VPVKSLSALVSSLWFTHACMVSISITSILFPENLESSLDMIARGLPR
jgi:hypothetical protein